MAAQAGPALPVPPNKEKFEVIDCGQCKVPHKDVPVINIQLDWNDPKQQEIWRTHLRYSGSRLVFTAMADEDAPLPKLAWAVIGPVLASLMIVIHGKTWEETYAAYPELKDVPGGVTFDGKLGTFKNTIPK